MDYPNIYSEQIERFISLVSNAVSILSFSKEVFTLEEAALYMGISSATLRHYTAESRIKHYKPTGKLIYFRKEEVIAFLLQNPVETEGEADAKALKRLL